MPFFDFIVYFLSFIKGKDGVVFSKLIEEKDQSDLKFLSISWISFSESIIDLKVY